MRRHLGDACPQFDRDLDRIVIAWFSRLSPPSVLYHYTDWNGFSGIVTSQRFWFTDHRCTNDSGELTTADALVKEVASGYMAICPTQWHPPLARLVNEYDATKVSQIAPTYIASFTEGRDNPHQWKRYGRNGTGVCIGIRTLNEQLDNEFEHKIGLALSKVTYSQDDLRRDLQTGFRQVLEAYGQFVLQQPDTVRRANQITWNALSRLAARAGIVAKTKDWEPEQEWRQTALCSMHERVPTQTRKSEGKRIDYLSLRLRNAGKRLAFAEVMLGSQCPQTLEDAKVILSSAGYDEGDMPIVSRSTTESDP